jgi:hypothetical protein
MQSETISSVAPIATSVTPNNVDLSTVGIRLREKHPSWNDQRVGNALLEYRRFLSLCKAYPSRKISPSLDVDEVWHLHILDTRKYPGDCEKLFGHFLHHEACIGERDTANLLETAALYEQLFGVNPGQEWLDAATCAGPGGGCGSAPVVQH